MQHSLAEPTRVDALQADQSSLTSPDVSACPSGALLHMDSNQERFEMMLRPLKSVERIYSVPSIVNV